ncbi:MAG: T9SS type A sorting domain-containing protein, partial [Panacibacter sp.]
INDNLPLNISDSAEYFVSYLPGTSTSSYFCRLFARQGAAPGTFNLGIASQAYKSTPISWIATDLTLNTTHLVTIGYELIPGPNNDDVAKLWVNAGYSATEPPAQASSVFLVGSEPAEASRLALRQAYGSATTGATPKCEIDAIKISTSWADATLPVTLKSFIANSQNGAINLSWVTENEINMKEYVIERSIDTRNFTSIGTLAAKNSGMENNYSYTDSKTLQRLMVLGGIVNNNLVISHAVATNGAMLKIISLNGTITATQHIQTGASQTVMDVSKLASGNYIAMFINGNEKQTVQFAKR